MSQNLLAKRATAWKEKRERSRPRATLPADFVEACRFYKIRTKADGKVAFDISRWHAEQVRFHRERSGRDIILKPRQIGFSTLELLRGLHQAQTRESYNVRVVIHDEKLGEALFRTVTIADESVRALGMAPSLGTDRAKELAYDKLSSSIAIGIAGEREHVAAKQGRSDTIHRLHATEVAFWAHPKTTMTGLLNAVPANGERLIESTPNGAQGWFHATWEASVRGDTEYKPHFFAWHDHDEYRLPVPPDFDGRPRDEHEEKLLSLGVDAEQITWWRAKVKTLTLDVALQENPCDPATCFRASGRPYIEQETLDWLDTQARGPIRIDPVESDNGVRLGRLLVWADPVMGDQYIVGADVAEGIGKDADAADVMSRATGETVATFWSDSIKPGDFGAALAAIGKQYTTSSGPALLAVERNNHGHAVITALETLQYPQLYKHTDDRIGWVTNGATRPVMFDSLARAYEERSTWTPDSAGVSEAKTLIKDTDGQPRARNKEDDDGAKDDRFVARAIAWQVRRTTPGPMKTTGASPKRHSEARAVGKLI